MRIYNKNKALIMDQIAHCEGNVYLRSKEGTIYEIKNNKETNNLIKNFNFPEEGLDLAFASPKDQFHFMMYLIDMPRKVLPR